MIKYVKFNLNINISKFKAYNHVWSIMRFLSPLILFNIFFILSLWFLRNFTFLIIVLLEFMRNITFYFISIMIFLIILYLWYFTIIIYFLKIQSAYIFFTGFIIFLYLGFLNLYSIFPILRPTLMVMLINIGKFTISLSVYKNTWDNYTLSYLFFDKLTISGILTPITFIVLIALFIKVDTISISSVILEISLIAIPIWVADFTFSTSFSFNKLSLICYKISIFFKGKFTRSIFLSI